MLFRSKYPSKCATCKALIAIGEQISWDRNTKESQHALCSVEGRAAVKAQEASRAVDAVFEPPAPEGKAYLGFQKAGIAYALRVFGDL